MVVHNSFTPEQKRAILEHIGWTCTPVRRRFGGFIWHYSHPQFTGGQKLRSLIQVCRAMNTPHFFETFGRPFEFAMESNRDVLLQLAELHNRMDQIQDMIRNNGQNNRQEQPFFHESEDESDDESDDSSFNSDHLLFGFPPVVSDDDSWKSENEDDSETEFDPNDPFIEFI